MPVRQIEKKGAHRAPFFVAATAALQCSFGSGRVGHHGSMDCENTFPALLRSLWKGRPRLIVFDSCFDGGERFTTLRDAWRSDPHRCTHLQIITASPDLASAQTQGRLIDALRDGWPPVTANMHRIAFDGGQLQWLLMPTELSVALRQLVAQVDVFLLATADAAVASEATRNAKALARLAHAGTVVWFDQTTGAEAHAMRSAGFVSQADGAARGEPMVSSAPASSTPKEGSRWHYAPSFIPRRAPSRSGAASKACAPVLVVGAGLSGCAIAWALAEQGIGSRVYERHGAAAMEASGNPAGLFHGIVNPQDGAHARFNRAAALEAQRAVAMAVSHHQVCGNADGLLRLQTAASDGESLSAMHASLRRLDLPAGFVQALNAHDASLRAGITLSHAAWWYPGGGWVQPAGLARSFLERAGRHTTLRTGCAVDALTRDASGWQLRDAAGVVIATSDRVVLANAGDALRLLRRWLPAGQSDAWPMARVRGQISIASQSACNGIAAAMPRVPITGSGYLLPLIDGQAIFGATSQVGDADPSVRDSDHAHNLARCSQLTGAVRGLEPRQLTGRTGWRWSTDDRLPVLGAVPDIPTALTLNRMEQTAQVPRLPGLYVCTAFGSRGVTWAALAAQVVAAQISGAALPIEVDLLDAVDAARFVARSARAHR
jgi:tRNA 5-methylaminomethyl-2-thiouridine biosynthesis bifunctional protein